MKLLGMKETFIDYKKVAMYLAFPNCKLSCEGCQNDSLRQHIPITCDTSIICDKILNNYVVEAVVLSGMNPIDSWDDMLEFINEFRKVSNYDIVIYTGYYEFQIKKYIEILKQYENIYVKFGRYKKDLSPKYNKLLGVILSSSNQYTMKIS